MRAYSPHRVEEKWQQTWEARDCHRKPRSAGALRYFAHDAAPFPNGGLHLGHVRTYVLGDMTARYQRLLGKAVLYHTGFDSFGLPIELEAIEQGISPRELVAQSKRTMERQLRRLGISYDWSMIPDTSDPACYRWTQWLFLEMFDAGLVERRKAPLLWCPGCETTLARLQVEKGLCWRCRSAVEEREFPQWFIAISRYADRLSATLSDLEGWSDQVKSMLRGLLRDREQEGQLDWLVSRQRSWGTPIPLVECPNCGVVPVAPDQLPVVLPEGLDWSGGSGALSRCESFMATSCPGCGAAARRETDTLDCFFDDIWCFLQGLVLFGHRPGFRRENLRDWLPVDRCQSGLDTFYYFHLYRFLGCFLVERGLIGEAEMIRSFIGSNLVLSRGRKMSKHLGNTVSPDEIVAEAGADALRVAMLWAAAPQRSMQWSRAGLEHAVAFLDRIYALVSSCRGIDFAAVIDPARQAAPKLSRAARALRGTTDRMLVRVAEFIEEFRPHAALAELSRATGRIERFATNRVGKGRLDPREARILGSVLNDHILALAPFAPHLAEECWQMLGNQELACRQRWPTSPPVSH